MKKKKLRRIAKRLMGKPLHFIDTCIFLENFERGGRWTRECERYLKRVGERKPYMGCVSVLVMGEYMNVAKDKPKAEFDNLMVFFHTFYNDASMSTISPNIKSLAIFSKIKSIERDMDFMDAMHLSCACESGIKTFVTIDEKLINNTELEKLLGMRIINPKDLV